ncbi:MAG: Uma2 family endonuclease, partial [Planctomycetia bacterium]|nr:Uma2 family endonuclease [Planctomycetia bacterium]
AYASAELVARTEPKAVFYDGAPTLAVEILSPSDRQEDIAEKVDLYLEVGSTVWVIDPDFRRLSVHRPGQLVETFNENHELSGEPELPGFRVRVAEFFS